MPRRSAAGALRAVREGMYVLELVLDEVVASEPFGRLLLERARPITARLDAGWELVVAALAPALDAPVPPPSRWGCCRGGGRGLRRCCPRPCRRRRSFCPPVRGRCSRERGARPTERARRPRKPPRRRRGPAGRGPPPPPL